MDLRVRQLTDEGVPRSAIIERMTGYAVDLGTIWNATTDEQLATLCREYPGFHTYAELMEEAAEAERQKPTRPYDGLPALPDAIKEQLSSLFSTAAKLERDHQSVLDAAGTAAPTSWRLPLGTRHAQWQADLARFRAALQDAGVPQKSRDMILPALERMAQQIGKLEARFQRSSRADHGPPERTGGGDVNGPPRRL
jgi:phosphoglycolate phosphatase-like HAD superfamily hydrolase